MSSWIVLFDEVNRVLMSVGALFEDCDRLLDQHGVAPAHGQRNRIERENRHNMDQPWGWYPGWFARQYTDGKNDGVLYIAVFLHDCGGKEDYRVKTCRLEEPVVTAGVLQYKKGCRWNHWHCKTWFWNNDGELGGEPVRSRLSGPKGYDGHALSFALKLESLRTKQDVDERVVQPLLLLVERQ